MKNKSGEVSITLLVLMTFLLTLITLFLFVTSSNKIQDKIGSSRFLDDLYIIEDKLDFYINEMIDYSIEKSKSSGNFKEDFIASFRQQAEKYKQEENGLTEEFSKISQDIENVEVTENEEGKKISFTASFSIEYKKDLFEVLHTYTKTFEREIPTQKV